MNSQFTELDTEKYYDSEDAIYRSFWSQDGSVHWGFFDQSTGSDFYKACQNLNCIMAQKAGIESESKVLDLGCGNGTTSLWLANAFGCEVTGIDLSGVRVGNAKEALKTQQNDVKSRVSFEKASVTDLPFEGNSFTHVWSQAVLYHVHDNLNALQEAYRVLAPEGTLVFDDLVKPRADISEAAKKYVYDRLLFDTEFSFESYKDALKDTGFQILHAEDLSQHLRKSYDCLSKSLRRKMDNGNEKMEFLALAYEKTCEAVDNHEVGWGLFLCRKPS